MPFIHMNMDTLRYQEMYIRNNNYQNVCSLHICCCECNVYRNGIYYLQQFICFITKQ
jgi:hypothetical protein